MISLSEKSKETASGLMNLLNTKDEGVSFSNSTPNVEILGNIYKLMVKQSVLDKTQDELDDDRNDQRHLLANRRHKEILEALSFQPKPAPTAGEKPQKKKTKKGIPLKKPRVKKVKVAATKAEAKIGGVTPKPAPVQPVKPVTPPAPVAATPVLPALGKAAAAVVGVGASVGALAKIKGHEGFRSSAYYDPKRDSSGKVLEEHYSVGYGHQITNDEIKKGYIDIGNKKVTVLGELGKDTVLTKEEAESLVKKDFEKYERYAKSIPNFDKLNEGAQTALVDMTYNMGEGWLKKWNTLNKQLQDMDLQNAAKTIRGSLYAKQVRDRAYKNADAIQNGLKNLPPTNVPSPNNVGTNIDSSSKENKELYEQLNAAPASSSTINQTNVNVSSPQQQRGYTPSVDERSAYERKSRIK